MIEQFDSFVEDFLGEKLERPLLIVGASKVDDLLFLIISNYFLPKISGKKDDLLEGDRPLATFSSKIKITYRLGIIDRELFKILEQLRAIRNLSAHGIAFDVKKSPLREHIATLKKEIKKRRSYELTKIRYFDGLIDSNIKDLQCILVTLCVVLQAVLAKTIRTTGIEETLKISKK